MEDLSVIYGRSIEEMTASYSAENRAFIAPAKKRLLEAIEGCCPAVLSATKQGLRSAYGPANVPKGTEFLFFAATPENAIWAACPSWPSPATDVPADALRGPAFWYAMAHLIDDRRGGLVPSYLTAKMGTAKIAEAKKTCAAIRRDGNTPTLIAVMAGEETSDEMVKGAGMMAFIPLPPSIEAQLGE